MYYTDRTNDNVSWWAYAAPASVMKSWLIYVELPQGYNNNNYQVCIPTYFIDPHGTQENLVWYGSFNENTKTSFSGAPVNSIDQAKYQHYCPGGWDIDGKHYDYAHYIFCFDNGTHTFSNDTYSNGILVNSQRLNGPMYWEWVYPKDGYSTKQDVLRSDVYLVNSSGRSTGMIGMSYRLLGHVVFDENNGTGNTSDQIYQFGMDIVNPNTPSMTHGSRNLAAPTKEGSTFLGWGTEKDGSTIYSKWTWNPVWYSDKSGRALRLYAQWVKSSITLGE